MINVRNDAGLNRLSQEISASLPNQNLCDLTIEAISHDLFGYRIERQETVIHIYYQERNHFFAALGQLLANPSMEGHASHPLFNRLGFMLDAARNAVPKVETLKQWIRLLALLGYTYLEIYVEDVMEIHHEPLVGHMRGKYSIEEIKELDQYAQDFGIELVPCIQTLAHLEGIFRHPEYKKIHDIDDILLVDNPLTYAWIDHVLSTTKEAFSSKRINIGMDEAWKLGLGRYLALNGYQDRLNIMHQHVEKVLKLCDKHQYQPSMWADMYFHLAGGGYHQKMVNFDSNLKNRIPQSVQLIYWDYYHSDERDYHQKYHSLKQLTSHYAFAAGAWKWIGFAPHNRFSIQTLKPALRAAFKQGVRDVMITSWGDNGGEASHFSILPTLIHVAITNQRFLKPENMKNRYAKMLTAYPFDELLDLDLPNLLSLKKPYTYSNPQKYLFYVDMLMGHRMIEQNQEQARIYLKHSQRLSRLAKRNSPYAYLFVTLSRLCAILSKKIELTVKIKTEYANRNQIMLNSLVKQAIKLSKEVRKFHQVFQNQWNKENKPFGFEIHSYRMGGLAQRIESIANTLADYVEKTLASIVELDQPTESLSVENPVLNQFHQIISYNKI